ncbi:hypothetical protein ACTQ6A_00305 [Lachnospiraceae bacterium LCP25S3_G4]
MNKYNVTLTAHYEKTVSVFADSPEQAQEKMKIILFDTDLIDFTDEDFVCGEAFIAKDNGCEESEAVSEDCNEDDCSGCDYLWPVCRCCMCGDEDED